MKIRTILLLSGLILLLHSIQVIAGPIAGERRAIVIGIDRYNPKNEMNARWINLDGCVNDANSFRDLLVARYGFNRSSVDTLFNAQATRVSILGHFKQLLDQSRQGDYVVIYYAGHGSQVKNSLSKEADKMDESMVPGDSWKEAADIRDKELAAEFNKFIDKGIVLTVIFDCCHSGSIGRGSSSNPPKFRYCNPIETDIKDPTEVTPPETRGMLIISAAQDIEFAAEQTDDQGRPHGAFTIALLQAMSTLSTKAPAMEIFENLRAILKFNGKVQEPIIAGTPERKKQTLFGIDKALLSNKTLVSVINVNDTAVELQGGITVGIFENSELKGKDKSGNTLQLKVTSISGLNRCIARVTTGNIKTIKPGDLFEVSNWVLPSMSTLKIFLPKSDFSETQLTEAAQKFYSLGKSGKISLVNDPLLKAPTHTIYYLEGHWYLGQPSGKPIDLGSNPSVKNIQQLLPETASLLINLPLTKTFYDSLIRKYNENSVVECVKNPGDAQYILSGRLQNGNIQYALVMPYLTGTDDTKISTMPLRTDYFTLQKDLMLIVDSLEDYSLRLAKVRAWLTISSPADDGRFPFRLGVRKVRTKEFMTSGILKKNDTIDLYLWVDPENLGNWDTHPRYIYVFTIDSKGKMDLFYPSKNAGSAENKLPASYDNKPTIPQWLTSGTISEPLGVDAYIMVSTDEPIPDPLVFNQPGVQTRGARSVGLKGKDPYSVLLNIGAKTRGPIATPTAWNIQKFTIKSIP